MPVAPIPFIGPSYTARTRTLDAQRCINLYPEVDESQQGKSVAALLGTPGLRLLTTLPGAGGLRGLYSVAHQGRVFAIRGQTVSEIFAGWSAREVGTLSGNRRAPVSMADNGTQLCIVDEPNGYIVDLQSPQPTLLPITNPNFRLASTVTFQDGYFIFSESEANNFFISQLYDGFSYNPLEVAAAEGNPDLIVAVQSDHRELWVIGQITTEVYYNSGNLDFPFDRIQGAYLEWGTPAPYTVLRGEESLWMLAGNRTGALVVMRLANYQGQRVSTHAVETALERATPQELRQATAAITLQQGHTFYTLNIGEQTWVYDTATQLWHERARLKPDGLLGRHRGERAVALGEILLMGDFENGNLYALNMETYTDAGVEIPRIRTAPYVGADRQWMYHESLEIDFERGIGLDGGLVPGQVPQAMLDWSSDDGATWSTPQWQTIGPLGHYTPRVKWNRLGRARDRIFRVTVTDPVKVAMVQAVLRVR